MADDGLIDFLLGASRSSVENTLLHRLADSNNRFKELLELLDKWAERRAEAIVIEYFLKYGDKLAGPLTISPAVTEIRPDKPGPISAVDFRERLRKIVESA